CVTFVCPSMLSNRIASSSWFTHRTINRSRPVFGSRRERSTDRIQFLVRAANDQQIASSSWFAPRTINRSRPVLGSCRERSTDRVQFLVRAANHQQIASCCWFSLRTINGSRPFLVNSHGLPPTCTDRFSRSFT